MSTTVYKEVFSYKVVHVTRVFHISVHDDYKYKVCRYTLHTIGLYYRPAFDIKETSLL